MAPLPTGSNDGAFLGRPHAHPLSHEDHLNRVEPAPTRAEGHAMTKRPGPRCPVCTHPNQDAIDLALATGVESRAEILRRYDLDRTAGYRHAHGGHLDERLVAHASEAAAEAVEGVLERIVALADRLDRRLANRDSSDASDVDVTRLARELRSVLDLLARVGGKLVDQVVVRDQAAGRWNDADVVHLLDALLASIELEWPDAAHTARVSVANMLSTSAIGANR